ncbi:DUF2285 domain-containing protein [Gluconacetobacter azotocaptans]|uniref:DNA -binding domain-containing protein n=1 Tax=Gluconacetobacter azotocaptans TaxID=142834 RepID=UPI00195DBDAD|nr:DUF2285 domain-containing protein [Gluconacetobacter azotocaptans]
MTVFVAAPELFRVRPLPDDLFTGDRTAQAAPGVIAIVVPDATGEHRLHLFGPVARARPAALIPLDGGEDLRVGELRRLLKRIARQPVAALPRALRLPPYRVWRLADVLCAYAGRLAGASQRDIGCVLDPAVRAMTAREWDSSPQRSRIARLLRTAHGLTERRGYLTLLRPPRFTIHG